MKRWNSKTNVCIRTKCFRLTNQPFPTLLTHVFFSTIAASPLEYGGPHYRSSWLARGPYTCRTLSPTNVERSWSFAAHRSPHRRPNPHLVLADVVRSQTPSDAKAVTREAGLTAKDSINALFPTKYDVPDSIYALHGIMLRESEDNFALGLQVSCGQLKFWHRC